MENKLLLKQTKKMMELQAQLQQQELLVHIFNVKSYKISNTFQKFQKLQNFKKKMLFIKEYHISVLDYSQQKCLGLVRGIFKDGH